MYKANGGVDRALTIALMENTFNACEDGQDAPTLIVTNENLYEKYWKLAEADKSLMNTMEGAMGITTLAFNGVPILKDRTAPAEIVFFVNENYMELFIHTDENFEVRPFQEPIDQNVASSKVFVTLNLASSNCRRQGQLRDLNYAL